MDHETFRSHAAKNMECISIWLALARHKYYWQVQYNVKSWRTHKHCDMLNAQSFVFLCGLVLQLPNEFVFPFNKMSAISRQAHTHKHIYIYRIDRFKNSLSSILFQELISLSKMGKLDIKKSPLNNWSVKDLVYYNSSIVWVFFSLKKHKKKKKI
jgi:hypothetical protein